MILSSSVIEHRDALGGLREPLERALENCGGLGTVCELESPAVGVVDSPTKHLVRNRAGQPVAVVLRSRHASPGLIARSVVKASLARKVLGSELGRVILPPVLSGESDGVSFAVYPWRAPLSGSRWLWPLQRAALRAPLLRWLRRATKATSGMVDGDALRANFHEPLRYMAGSATFGETTRAAAREAIGRLETGTWKPRYVLAHNDLWKGNVLLHPRSQPGTLWRRFVLIDWAGSEVGGYPFYDLVCLGMSLQISRRRLARELRAHCEMLDCRLDDAKGYLLAWLGRLGTHLECFPVERFRALVSACCGWMFPVVDGRC